MVVRPSSEALDGMRIVIVVIVQGMYRTDYRKLIALFLSALRSRSSKALLRITHSLW